MEAKDRQDELGEGARKLLQYTEIESTNKMENGEEKKEHAANALDPEALMNNIYEGASNTSAHVLWRHTSIVIKACYVITR